MSIDQSAKRESTNEAEQAYLIAYKKVLTLDEACLYTGIKKSYMYRLTSERKIPHSKPNGKLIYFEREKLDEWMLQNECKTQQEIERIAATVVNIPVKSKIINKDKIKAA